MRRSPEVDAWMDAWDNPMKDVVQAVREILLAADPRIEECIKWKSPTFVYGGNLASFNPRAKAHASLMFHTGAEIPGEHACLEGTGDVARYVKIASVEDAERLRPCLQAVTRAWIRMKDAG